MKTSLISLAILLAVAVALAQIINWENVAEEYKPVTNVISKVVNAIPSNKEIIESVADEEVIEIETEDVLADGWWGKVTETTVTEQKVKIVEMPIDETRGEISNHNYDWLQDIEDVCPPTHKRNIKAAFDNDGMIRENEYYILIGICNDYVARKKDAEAGGGAKQQLREFAN